MISKRNEKGTPEISTASLPDIIFILLFFFMVVTVMRETEQLVSVNYPEATELTKLEKRSLVSNIYVGPLVNAKGQSHATKIQLSDQIASIEDVGLWVRDRVAELPPNKQNAFTVSLKVDADTKMDIVSKVKQELRKSAALKVNYSALHRLE